MPYNSRELDQAVPAKKACSAESLVFLLLLGGAFFWISSIMGVTNMMNTMMNTAYRLLIDTVLYIMAIAVLAGALSGLLTEFGIVSVANKLLSPLVGRVYGLPGASVVGIFATYFSDNPAILTLAHDTGFRRYFKKYQLPALTNIGTAFGMGLIITTFMFGLRSPGGEVFGTAALIGNLGAVCGSIVSVRMMLWWTSRIYGTKDFCDLEADGSGLDLGKYRAVRPGNASTRFLSSMLDGGKAGVEMGVAIIPGVLIICTVVMMLTNGPSGGGNYSGAAYEGISLLPFLGEKLKFVLDPLFGFSSSQAISIPITALGAAGAAISLIPRMVAEGLVNGNDIAVFTAICMCWSGYLSTHVAMMDSLGCSELTGKAIVSHTVGGIVAGISAHFFYLLFAMLS